MNTIAPRQSRPVAMRLTGLIMLAASTMLSMPVSADDVELTPTADYSPDQVVRIVIEALQHNNAENDDGIATVFRFASPGNRANTGPLSRFTSMIKRGFPDMLSHTSARFDPMEISDNTAVQAVWLLQPDGKETGYAFQLGKQSSGQFDGIWMTEAVVPLGLSDKSGTRI